MTVKLHKPRRLSFSVSLSLVFFHSTPPPPALPLLYRNWPISWACFSILLPCACIFYMRMFLCSSVCACSSSSVCDWLSANSLKCHNSLVSQEEAGWRMTQCARWSLSQVVTFSAWCLHQSTCSWTSCKHVIDSAISLGFDRRISNNFFIVHET